MSINLKKALTFSGIMLCALISFFVPYVTYTLGEDISVTELGFQALFQHGWHIEIFVMMLIYALIVASGVLLLFKEKSKALAPISFVLALSSASMVVFANTLMEHIYALDGYKASFNFGLILLAIIAVLMSLVSFLSIDKESSVKDMSVYEMCEISVFVALAVVLDMFAKIDLNEGAGSIGFQMLPLMIIALRHGPVKGFIACGIVFGIITCITDGWGLHTFPFDYLLGFGSTALLGFFKNFILPKEDGTYIINMKSEAKQFGLGVAFIIVGALCVFVGRTLASTISGMIFYNYTFTASLVYQMSYIPATVGVCAAILIVLYKPLLMINKRFKTR